MTGADWVIVAVILVSVIQAAISGFFHNMADDASGKPGNQHHRQKNNQKCRDFAQPHGLQIRRISRCQPLIIPCCQQISKN